MARVLVADMDAPQRARVQAALEGDGHAIARALSLSELQAQLGRNQFQLIVCDDHALFREGLDIWRAALPAGDWQTAAAESLVGVALSRLGRFEEAESLLAGSCSVLADRRGGGDERAREARAWLVELYERWGKDGRAAAVRCGSPG